MESPKLQDTESGAAIRLPQVFGQVGNGLPQVFGQVGNGLP